MTGYQEILADPSYAGQIVTMTYPEIGNYGVNPNDRESKQVFLRLIVRNMASRIQLQHSGPRWVSACGVVAIKV